MKILLNQLLLLPMTLKARKIIDNEQMYVHRIEREMDVNRSFFFF